MKRYYANILLRLAFKIFRRYHEQLPKELNGIIWGEMTRRVFALPSRCEPGCSMCASEAEEDRERQETVKRWLKGEIA